MNNNNNMMLTRPSDMVMRIMQQKEDCMHNAMRNLMPMNGGPPADMQAMQNIFDCAQKNKSNMCVCGITRFIELIPLLQFF
jgi:hypothetical protein